MSCFSFPLFLFALESSSLKFEQAKSCYVQQDQDAAFKNFLASLDEHKQCSPYKSTHEEQSLYQSALKVYLVGKANNGLKGSEEIVSFYGPIVEKHPDYCELAYLVATAQANLGDYLKFFDLFYRTYQQHPTHYLAYKTKGILQIKLFERLLPGIEKEKIREEMIAQFFKAAEIYPFDTSLYRLIILYSSQTMQQKNIRESLNKIIREDIVIPRGELNFYLDQVALLTEDTSLIKRFIDKAAQWYPYSRAIENAKIAVKVN